MDWDHITITADRLAARLPEDTPRSLHDAMTHASSTGDIHGLLATLGRAMRTPNPSRSAQAATEELLTALMIEAVRTGHREVAVAVLSFAETFRQAAVLFAPGWRRCMVRTAPHLVSPRTLRRAIEAIGEKDRAYRGWVPRLVATCAVSNYGPYTSLLHPGLTAPAAALTLSILRELGMEREELDTLWEHISEPARGALSNAWAKTA